MKYVYGNHNSVEAMISHFASLARMCGHLALDVEAKHGHSAGSDWYRGKAAGYLAAARSLKENESFRVVQS